MADLFFRVPFAVEGDQNTIPEALQQDGTVSMQTGWTFDYERDPATDPNAKDIQRGDMNGLLYRITAALRQMQTTGTYPYITAEMNGGNAFPYIQGARCLFEDAVYESLVNNNTSAPTDRTKWRNTSNTDSFIGDIRLVPYRASALPPKWYYTNGGVYLLSSPVGAVLNSLDTDFKTDWGITVTDDSISLPRVVSPDGKGLVVRGTDGITRQVGSYEADTVGPHRQFVGQYNNNLTTWSRWWGQNNSIGPAQSNTTNGGNAYA